MKLLASEVRKTSVPVKSVGSSSRLMICLSSVCCLNFGIASRSAMLRAASVMVYPGARQLARQRTREGKHGALRRHVGEHHGQAEVDGIRRDVDDLSPALLLHDRDDGLAAKPDTLHVHRHRPIPLLLGDLVEGHELRVIACVIDECVDSPEPFDRLRRHGLSVGLARYVGPYA